MAKPDYDNKQKKKMFPPPESQETCKEMIKVQFCPCQRVMNSLKYNNDVISSLPLCKIHPWLPGENMYLKSLSVSFTVRDKLLRGKCNYI